MELTSGYNWRSLMIDEDIIKVKRNSDVEFRNL
jgi:hypothetical protein